MGALIFLYWKQAKFCGPPGCSSLSLILSTVGFPTSESLLLVFRSWFYFSFKGYSQKSVSFNNRTRGSHKEKVSLGLGFYKRKGSDAGVGVSDSGIERVLRV